jgi:hypothetical protein
MRPQGFLYWLGVFIAVATAASGALQMVCPRFVLGLVGAEIGPTTSHFFAIVGMFMLLFGGLTFQGLLQWESTPLLWASLQKFGAAAAVGIGVMHNLFAPLALAVAVFDLLSGLLFAWLWLGSLSD